MVEPMKPVDIFDKQNNASFDAKKLFGNHQTRILPKSFNYRRVEGTRTGVNANQVAILLIRSELSNRHAVI